MLVPGWRSDLSRRVWSTLKLGPPAVAPDPRFSAVVMA